MTYDKPTSFRVDYYYRRIGVDSKTRTQLGGSVSQHLYGATTESVVMDFLRKKHPGLACCRFGGHRDKVFQPYRRFPCSDECSAESSSLRR